MMKNDQTVRPEDVPSDDLIDHNRREVLSALSVAVAGSAMAIFPSSTQAQSDASSTPRRALTGRDEANKSVFNHSMSHRKSFGSNQHLGSCSTSFTRLKVCRKCRGMSPIQC